MRRSERDAALASVFRRVLAGACGAAAEAGIGLAIGLGISAPERASAVPDLSQACALKRRFSSVLWVLSWDAASLGAHEELRASTVCAGLSRLRRDVLLPGATLLLVARKRAPALQQLRALLTGASVQRVHLQPLCNGVLSAGLLSPRVHDELPGWLLVSAALSPSPDALDAFFQQPREADVR